MDENKRKKSAGSRFVESLLFIGAADLAAILIKFILQFFTMRIRQAKEFEEMPGSLAIFNNVLAGLCLIGFFVVLTLLISRNPIYRGNYLNDTVGQSYRFGADLKDTVRSRALPDLFAAALLGLPLYTVLLIVGDINYLPTLFAPFYAMWELTGNAIVSWIAMALLIPAWMILVSALSHRSWEKRRLRKK